MLCSINLELLCFNVFIYLSIYLFFILTVLNYFFILLVCVSAFEQGHLDPWCSKSALLIIIIIIIILSGTRNHSVYNHFLNTFTHKIIRRISWCEEGRREGRQTGREAGRQADREGGGKAGREGGRREGRQTGREAGRQAEKVCS